MRLSISLPLTLLSILLVSPAAAESEPAPELTTQPVMQRALAIVRTARLSYVNEELHREYWKLAKKTTAPGDFALMPDAFRRVNAANMPWGRASWLNVRECLRRGETVEGPGVLEAAANLRAAYADIGLSTAQVDEFVQQMRAVCRAAATKSPYRGPDGSYYVTEEFIEKTLDRLGPSHERLRRLLNPVWDATPREQVFADIQLKLLSSEVFERKALQIEAVNANRGNGIYYLAQLDEKRVIGFSQLQVASGYEVTDVTLVLMLKGAAKSAGAEIEAWKVTSLHGARALSACVPLQAGGWMCAETVAGKDKVTAYQFFTLEKTRAQANGLLERLLAQTQFLD